ncbi:MAG: lysoplasmalogenase [Spirochaetes bacterium]|nr:lysoplasmalogenase [Spirochaetota bacterium]
MDLFGIPCFTSLLAALTAVLVAREVATFRGTIWLKYILTPLVTLIIAGFVLLSMREYEVTAYRTLIISAIAFSLVADTMLMIVETNLMKHGIAFFMLAHLMYILAFSLEYKFRIWHGAVAAVMLVFVWRFNMRIRGPAGALQIPITIYAVVLSLMLFFAISSISLELSRKTVLIFAGALLFAISDFLIAFLTFIRPHKQESVIVWAIYAPAQLMIALSCFS